MSHHKRIMEEQVVRVTFMALSQREKKELLYAAINMLVALDRESSKKCEAESHKNLGEMITGRNVTPRLFVACKLDL